MVGPARLLPVLGADDRVAVSLELVSGMGRRVIGQVAPLVLGAALDARLRPGLHRLVQPGMPVGDRSPLYAGASSKCLLAFSPQDFIENYLKKTALTPLTKNTITDINRLGSEIAAAPGLYALCELAFLTVDRGDRS